MVLSIANTNNPKWFQVLVSNTNNYLILIKCFDGFNDCYLTSVILFIKYSYLIQITYNCMVSNN